MRSTVAGLARALLCAGLALLVATAAQAEFKPISPFAATEVAPGPPSAFAPPTAAPFQAPGPLGRVFAWVFDKQQSLQRTLAVSVRSLKSDPLGGAITLAVLSFVYGVLHAVGPGHGKTIISSYVVANEDTVRRGVIISFIAAGLQALTAVVLVGVLLIALGSRELALKLGGTNSAWASMVWTTCAIGGPTIILLFGLLMFMASLGPARPF